MLGLRKHLAGLRFDRRHRIETNQKVSRSDLTGMPMRLRQHAGEYAPTHPALFMRIVRYSRIDPKDFGFVDLGSGKGRIVIAAADCGFRTVLGIEADRALHEVAEKNLAVAELRSDASVALFHGDARTAPLPEGNMFVFMYSPFRGPVFEAVAKRLAERAKERGQAVVVAYSADWEAAALERTGVFTRVRMRRRRFWAPSTVSIFYSELALRLRR